MKSLHTAEVFNFISIMVNYLRAILEWLVNIPFLRATFSSCITCLTGKPNELEPARFNPQPEPCHPRLEPKPSNLQSEQYKVLVHPRLELNNLQLYETNPQTALFCPELTPHFVQPEPHKPQLALTTNQQIELENLNSKSYGQQQELNTLQPKPSYLQPTSYDSKLQPQKPQSKPFDSQPEFHALQSKHSDFQLEPAKAQSESQNSHAKTFVSRPGSKIPHTKPSDAVTLKCLPNTEPCNLQPEHGTLLKDSLDSRPEFQVPIPAVRILPPEGNSPKAALRNLKLEFCDPQALPSPTNRLSVPSGYIEFSF